MTNYEKLKNCTLDELVNFLEWKFPCGSCPAFYDETGKVRCIGKTCKEGIAEYLNSEAKE